MAVGYLSAFVSNVGHPGAAIDFVILAFIWRARLRSLDAINFIATILQHASAEA